YEVWRSEFFGLAKSRQMDPLEELLIVCKGTWDGGLRPTEAYRSGDRPIFILAHRARFGQQNYLEVVLELKNRRFAPILEEFGDFGPASSGILFTECEAKK